MFLSCQQQCHIDAVGQFTSITREAKKIPASGGHSETLLPAGSVQQNFIWAANLDPTVFPEPLRFDPTRDNLNKILNWNAPLDQVETAPRGCPGKALSQALVIKFVQYLLPALQAGHGQLPAATSPPPTTTTLSERFGGSSSATSPVMLFVVTVLTVLVHVVYA